MSNTQQPGDSKSTEQRLTQPGDSKSTIDKLTGDAKAVGQNIQDTASHHATTTSNTNASYASKSDIQGNAEAAKQQGASALSSVGNTLGAVGSNVQGNASHAADKTGSAARNVQDTAANYADKADTKATENADYAKREGASALENAGNTIGSVGQNVQETAQNYAEKARSGTNTTTSDGQKTYLEQAQDLASGALSTAGNLVKDAADYVAGSAEKK